MLRDPWPSPSMLRHLRRFLAIGTAARRAHEDEAATVPQDTRLKMIEEGELICFIFFFIKQVEYQPGLVICKQSGLGLINSWV